MGDPTYTIYAEIPPRSLKEGPGKLVPGDYQWKPLGRGEEIRGIITSYFPDIKWYAPASDDDFWDGQIEWHGEFYGEKIEGWSEFSVRGELCDNIFVKCYHEHSYQLLKLCKEQGWFLHCHTMDWFINDPDDDQTMEELLDKALDVLTLGRHRKTEKRGFLEKLMSLFNFRSH